MQKGTVLGILISKALSVCLFARWQMAHQYLSIKKEEKDGLQLITVYITEYILRQLIVIIFTNPKTMKFVI